MSSDTACAGANARGLSDCPSRRPGTNVRSARKRWKFPKNGQFSTINSESLALTAAFSALLSAVFGGSIQHNEVG